MKLKLGWLYILAVSALMISVGFQSVHSIGHLHEIFHEEKCEHKPTDSKHEITHQHHSEKDCPVCHWNLSNAYLSDENIVFWQQLPDYQLVFSTCESPTLAQFSGSQYSHRGPPTI